MILDFINSIRKNHALEHATVSLLLSKLKPGSRLMGRATTNGFYIYGDVPDEEVLEAAEEALGRLKQGEHNLAVSPFCGTNLAVAAILAGLASMSAMRGSKETNRLPNVLLAALTAVVAAQPLGRLTQKYLTTSADVDDIDIAAVTSTRKGKHTRHKITTLRG